MKASMLALTAVIVIAVEVALLTPALLKRMVMLVATLCERLV